MTVQQLIDKNIFTVLNEGTQTDRELTQPYCCDLLSIAMAGAPAGCAWATVMGNLNTIAVATLTEAGCVILCNNTQIDEMVLNKAKEEGITILQTPMASFDAGLEVYQLLHA